MCHVTRSFGWRQLPALYASCRGVFTDPIRRKKLETALEVDDAAAETKQPISWDPEDVEAMEQSLRHKLRVADFVVEVRDARIPVSTLHPELRRWSGKKPRVMVFNKADLIAHRDRVEWERHFEQKNMHVIWTAALMKNGGIANLIRRFFDANFEVNRRRRKTNLPLRPNRAVLTCLVGHPNVGKRSLIERLIGPNPKTVQDPIPDKGRPDLLDDSLTWYKVEGGVYLMDQPGEVPPVIENSVVCTRLAMCGNYDKAVVSDSRTAEEFIAHLGSLRRGRQIMDKMGEALAVHPTSLPPQAFLREVAEMKFDGDTESAARHILDSFERLDYGPAALEMPYMLQGNFKLEEPLIYDKDTATGIQTGICSQF